VSRADESFILIAVLAFRGAQDLEELLQDLIDQARIEGRPVEILVVDNHPDAAARSRVTGFQSSEPIRYVHESAPGIAAARNRALVEASESDLLVFIDDEERPTAHWLANLLATYAEYHPAAVAGPVLAQYDVEPSPWIRASRFFELRRFRTGTPVSVAATKNLLLDVRQVRGLGVLFDARYGPNGGSESLFTRQLHERGGELIWCDEAIIIDVVPAERLTREWVLNSAFGIGDAWSRMRLEDAPPGRRILVRCGLVALGAGRSLGGLGRYVLGALTGQLTHRARGLHSAALGAGTLAGAVRPAARDTSRSELSLG